MGNANAWNPVLRTVDENHRNYSKPIQPAHYSAQQLDRQVIIRNQKNQRPCPGKLFSAFQQASCIGSGGRPAA